MNDAWTPRQRQADARRQEVHGPLQNEPVKPGSWAMTILWTGVVFLTVAALFSA